METVLVQLNNAKAYKLLEDLQELQIITLLPNNGKTDEPKLKPSEKYRGVLPADVAEELRKHVKNSREEWDNNSI